ncbi:hypothetical protein OG921_23985 [Aldersonia sp. NBC_00410]|uniref:hypothetical protein n=1 Tax=Aldersonia sp. NBC_00410 TaxID=2975954 RepID=UPI0022587173|nr:hypothetical protein [Aldersonia sp. NBC_00410]MCX5046236.1 hypothetical protein [Aldersonia sp. NBC_00410]
MNGFEFASELVGVLIWPLVVIGLAVCWRKPIATLLNRIARGAKSVSGPGFSVELETRIEQLVESAGLALAPGGSVDAEHSANVRHPVPLTPDPVAAIHDSYQRVRYAAVNKLAELDRTQETFEIQTITHAMEWYLRVRGPVDEALRLVTAEIEDIYAAVMSIEQPLGAFSPKERAYATHYQAVAQRVIEHFDFLK